MRLTLCLLLSLASLWQVPAPPQNPQEPKISVDVQLVTVLATVQNKKAVIVSNLTKDDFLLQQDGHPQTIQYFKQEANLPLTLGLLVDTSLSQRNVLGQERSASYSFLDHVLREDEDKDKAFRSGSQSSSHPRPPRGHQLKPKKRPRTGTQRQL